MSFGLSAGTISLIGAGASVASGLLGANAADSAADQQAAAANQANDTQLRMFEQTRRDNAPFQKSGVAANNMLARLLGISEPERVGAMSRQSFNALYDQPVGRGWRPDELANIDRGYEDYLQTLPQAAVGGGDPAYGSLMRDFSMADRDADPVYQSGLQFGLDEGRKGIQRMASATGSTQSGATLKALTRFGNDYASTKANDAYNRFSTGQTNKFNRLAGVSGAGQTASGQVGAAGQQMANNVSQNQLAVGNARGASTIAGTNSLLGGFAGALNGLQQRSFMPQAGYDPNRMFVYGAGGEL